MLLTQRIQETNYIPAKIHGTGKLYLHVHLVSYDNLLGTYTSRNEMRCGHDKVANVGSASNSGFRWI